ncbi:hypothetical protein CUMW_281230 [Citrus unshiu]|uniref:Uncharacterized protein n=1 Tax=Citrus unshiu TaxID=55188 RepID=A0A2H5MWS6_CITUN|nr:hypothetical protein CUMW_281230 [Citrus unshiu]
MARIEADGKEDYTGHQGQLGKFAPTTGGVKKTTPFQAGNSGFERDQEQRPSRLFKKLPRAYLVGLFETPISVPFTLKRVTIMPKDIQALQGESEAKRGPGI